MLKFTKKGTFSHKLLGFTKLEITRRTYTSEKPFNFKEIDKNQSKGDFRDTSIVNGNRQHFYNTFAVDKPPGQKKKQKMLDETLQKKLKPISNCLIVYVEDGEKNRTIFNAEKLTLII